MYTIPIGVWNCIIIFYLFYLFILFFFWQFGKFWVSFDFWFCKENLVLIFTIPCEYTHIKCINDLNNQVFFTKSKIKWDSKFTKLAKKKENKCEGNTFVKIQNLRLYCIGVFFSDDILSIVSWKKHTITATTVPSDIVWCMNTIYVSVVRISRCFCPREDSDHIPSQK
jgi:energy-coupling factor transporter transmembrane protein EcfT